MIYLGTSLVWRKSKISMQEDREVQGKSTIRLIPNIVYYFGSNLIKWEPSIPMLNSIQIIVSEKKCTLLLASPESGLRQSFLFFPQLLSFFFLFFNLWWPNTVLARAFADVN